MGRDANVMLRDQEKEKQMTTLIKKNDFLNNIYINEQKTQ